MQEPIVRIARVFGLTQILITVIKWGLISAYFVIQTNLLQDLQQITTALQLAKILGTILKTLIATTAFHHADIALTILIIRIATCAIQLPIGCNKESTRLTLL